MTSPIFWDFWPLPPPLSPILLRVTSPFGRSPLPLCGWHHWCIEWKKIHNFTSPVNIWKNYYDQYWSFDMKSFIFSLVSPTNVKKKISLKLTFYQNVSREKGLIFFEENFKLNLQFFWIHISVLKNK